LSIWRDRTEAKVVRVVDGDTIRVDIDDEEYAVRYIGINTPETYERGYANATKENRRLVAGQTVFLERDVSDTDHWGRLLRNVFLEDGTFVNAELVRSGHAEVSTHLPDVRYKSLLEGSGILGKILGLFLLGEQASGTVLYGARKKLGMEIDWIEEREEGELFKEISPSQALGFSTPETKLISARGVPAFVIDVALIGKGAKVGKALKIGSKIDDTLTVVGPKGIKYLEETIQRGISRPTAEKKLLEAIGRGKTEYLAAKKYAHLAARKYAEPTVHIFGQKLLYTSPYQRAAMKVWDVLPYAEKRAKGVDIVRTAVIPFHKAAQDVSEAVTAPFRWFYRQFRPSKEELAARDAAASRRRHNRSEKGWD
jgi:hypothetical protein